MEELYITMETHLFLNGKTHEFRLGHVQWLCQSLPEAKSPENLMKPPFSYDFPMGFPIQILIKPPFSNTVYPTAPEEP